MTQRAALAAALDVEHQVVYGYGVAGAHLSGRARATAADALAAHETRRDELAALLAQQHIPAPAAAVGYAMPFPVTDAASATRLCIRLEDAAAGAAWDLVAASAASSPTRMLGVAWLTDAATRAARWRGPGPQPPLPGQPG